MARRPTPSTRDARYLLVIHTKQGARFAMTYKEAEKAQNAQIGIVEAMRNSDEDAVVTLGSNEIRLNWDGVNTDQMPVFAVRVGEISSSYLHDLEDSHPHKDDEEDEEEQETQ